MKQYPIPMPFYGRLEERAPSQKLVVKNCIKVPDTITLQIYIDVEIGGTRHSRPELSDLIGKIVHCEPDPAKDDRLKVTAYRDHTNPKR